MAIENSIKPKKTTGLRKIYSRKAIRCGSLRFRHHPSLIVSLSIAFII